MHIVVIFINIGAYHAARIRAAYEASTERGWRFTAIQVTDYTLDHSWGFEVGAEFPLKTLLPTEGPTQSIRRDAFSSVAGSAVSRELDRLRPDVVFVPGWSYSAAQAGIQWCMRNDARTVMMSESTGRDEARVAWKESIKRLIVSACSAALVGGKLQAQYVTELGMAGDRVFPGYTVVDNAHFERGAAAAVVDPAATRQHLNVPHKYFLSSGRFIAKKNLPVVLEAFAAYRATAGAGSWKLVVLGDGPQRDELLRMRDALGLDAEVTFPGFMPYDLLPSYYAFAGALIHASTSEQWGLVVNEAMAAGLPVIVSNRCGCAPDLVVDGRNGFTFEPSDRHALTSSMLSVASDEGRRAAMGQQSRAIIANWSPAFFARGFCMAADAARSSERKRYRFVTRAVLPSLLKFHSRPV